MLGKHQEVQIAVVGAGPAGARVSEVLSAEGADVLLIDPKAPWEKPCGGGLTASAFKDIPDLWELESQMRSISSVRVETDADHGFTLPLATPLRVVSRLELARWQLERALAAGVTHLPARIRSVSKVGGVWWLVSDQGTIRAHRLVGADGAASLIRKSVARGFQVELAPTRVAYVSGAGPSPDTALLRFFPSVAGYAWEFPRTAHRSVGVGIQAGGWRRARMDRAVDRVRFSAEGCLCGDTRVERAGAVIGTAQLGHGDFARIGSLDFALLGDAAGLADPTTGEGIRNALRSADLLAEAWRRDGNFEPYPQLAREAFSREFEVSRVLRRLIFEGDFGSRALASAQRSRLARAAVTTAADAINEQDGSILSLIRRWWATSRVAHVEPDLAMSGPRSPASCGCGCGLEPGAAMEEEPLSHAGSCAA